MRAEVEVFTFYDINNARCICGIPDLAFLDATTKELNLKMRWILRLLGLEKRKSSAAAPAAETAPTPEPEQQSAADEQVESMIAAVQQLNLRKEKAYPLLYLDCSGSTNERPNKLWDDGTMQLLTSLVAAVALGGFSATRQKTVPLRFFSYNVRQPMWPSDGLISRDNVNQILRRNHSLVHGGTYFIPPLMDMVRQALLISARENMAGGYLAHREETIKAMSDDELLRFITPQIVNGKEVLKPILKLNYPISAFLGTDGMCAESLARLLEVVRWMSQIGIYIMLIGVGHHDFAVLKGMDAAGEELFLKKGLKPLWDNVDFIDLKDLTGSANRLPDGPTVVSLLVGKFMSTAYESCRDLRLIT